MKKHFIIAGMAAFLGAVATASFAVAPGFYLGTSFGPATNGGGSVTVYDSHGVARTLTPQTNQFGAHLFLGNKFNDYAGFELAFDYFTKFNYNTKNIDLDGTPTAFLHALDLMVKGTLPLGNSFDIFAKGGIAYAFQTNSGCLNQTTKTGACGVQTNDGRFRPVVGVGASYDLNQNWVLDFSLTSIMAGGVVNRVTFAALGISYHFVDTYCGQFIC